jgi:hypothetical protein
MSRHAAVVHEIYRQYDNAVTMASAAVCLCIGSKQAGRYAYGHKHAAVGGTSRG